ncbi:hypothetical protein [Lactobacillus equicursoris]|uniref:hypothetical protein n=1 Tax=Lactobacillus equicursoris TaxID=420645 RepID=UPI003995F7B7
MGPAAIVAIMVLEVIIQELCFLDFILKKFWDIFPVKKGKFRTICLPLWVIIGICLNNLDQASRELKTTLPGVYHQLQTKRLI